MFASTPQPGTLLAGRYHIDRLLHAGRGGVRLLVLDTQDGMRPLALQECPVRFPSSAARAAALSWIQECVAQLHERAHANLCPVRAVEAPSGLDTP